MPVLIKYDNIFEESIAMPTKKAAKKYLKSLGLKYNKKWDEYYLGKTIYNNELAEIKIQPINTDKSNFESTIEFYKVTTIKK